MAGVFVVYKDRAGEYRFRLKAGNGEVILTSEGYIEKSGCTNGIEAVRRNSTNTGRFDKKKTESGKYRFNLKSANHQVIGTSQNYKSESGRDNGISSVGRNAPGAKVVEI